MGNRSPSHVLDLEKWSPSSKQTEIIKKCRSGSLILDEYKSDLIYDITVPDPRKSLVGIKLMIDDSCSQVIDGIWKDGLWKINGPGPIYLGGVGATFQIIGVPEAESVDVKISRCELNSDEKNKFRSSIVKSGDMLCYQTSIM